MNTDNLDSEVLFHDFRHRAMPNWTNVLDTIFDVASVRDDLSVADIKELVGITCRLISQSIVIDDIRKDGPYYPQLFALFLIARKHHKEKYRKYVVNRRDCPSIVDVHQELFHVLFTDEVRYSKDHMDFCAKIDGHFYNCSLDDKEISEKESNAYFDNQVQRLTEDPSNEKNEYSKKLKSEINRHRESHNKTKQKNKTEKNEAAKIAVVKLMRDLL